MIFDAHVHILNRQARADDLLARTREAGVDEDGMERLFASNFLRFLGEPTTSGTE